MVADQATARGESWGRLHGIPVTVKDAIATKGIRSTGGAEALFHHVPQDDAQVVTAIKDAGAIVIGKTNVPLWSGDFQTFNDMFGTTNNPWDLSRVPGGSSGGAAAAVACGMTSFEIGTDIGGSVRVPAAFCGVYGHKPSFGVVPTLGYLDEPHGGLTESDVNVFGPIARSAGDLQLLARRARRPDLGSRRRMASRSAAARRHGVAFAARCRVVRRAVVAHGLGDDRGARWGGRSSRRRRGLGRPSRPPRHRLRQVVDRRGVADRNCHSGQRWRRRGFPHRLVVRRSRAGPASAAVGAVLREVRRPVVPGHFDAGVRPPSGRHVGRPARSRSTRRSSPTSRWRRGRR